ncbi:MAG: helix-turn-helix transcriptional regulator [Clostridia bacterium]|nr:helix-turn-helix transcriptional regulator [Clostridia bacterium]
MFNENIKNLRIAGGMNQVQLAKKLGVSKQTISNWENDNILPSVEMLINIAKCFSVSLDYLMGFDNQKYINVTGLSDKQISNIQSIINDMK